MSKSAPVSDALRVATLKLVRQQFTELIDNAVIDADEVLETIEPGDSAILTIQVQVVRHPEKIIKHPA